MEEEIRVGFKTSVDEEEAMAIAAAQTLRGALLRF